MILTHAERRLQGVGELIVALREHAQGVGDLPVSGHRDAAKPIGEVGIEILVQIFVGVEDAGHPVESPVVARQAQFLGKHIEIAVQVFVRVVELRGVPIRIFAPDEFVVGGNAGEFGAAEIDIGGQIDAIVAVIETGLGIRADTDELGKGRIESPACDIARGIRGNGWPAVARRIGLQQVQALFIGLILRPMNVEPKVDRFRWIPLQLAANRDLVFVAQGLSGDAIALPRAALFRCHGEPSRQPVGNAAGHEPFRVDFIVRAIFQRESRMRVRGGTIADEIDLAAGGIAAVQGALRTAQHFNAIDVEQLALSLDRQRERDAVQAHAHRRGIIGGVVDEADASQTKLRLTAAERGLHLQAGDRVL